MLILFTLLLNAFECNCSWAGMHVYSSTPTGILNKWKVRTERLSLVFFICVIPQRLVSNNTRVSSRSRKQQREYNCGGRITIILARPNDNRTHGCGLTLLHDSVAALLIGRLGVFFLSEHIALPTNLCLSVLWLSIKLSISTSEYTNISLIFYILPFGFTFSCFSQKCAICSQQVAAVGRIQWPQ
jgi:hypothetical protein